MATIHLSQGQHALVDDQDVPRLSKFKWHSAWDKNTKSFRASRTLRLGGRKTRRIMMTWEIMGHPNRGLVIDHKNHDTLDNRRENLRLCTYSTNNTNTKGIKRNCASGIRGVYWNPNISKWMSALSVNGKRTYLGCFSDKTKARDAYLSASARLRVSEGGTCLAP